MQNFFGSRTCYTLPEDVPGRALRCKATYFYADHYCFVRPAPPIQPVFASLVLFEGMADAVCVFSPFFQARGPFFFIVSEDYMVL